MIRMGNSTRRYVLDMATSRRAGAPRSAKLARDTTGISGAAAQGAPISISPLIEIRRPNANAIAAKDSVG